MRISVALGLRTTISDKLDECTIYSERAFFQYTTLTSVPTSLRPFMGNAVPKMMHGWGT